MPLASKMLLQFAAQDIGQLPYFVNPLILPFTPRVIWPRGQD